MTQLFLQEGSNETRLDEDHLHVRLNEAKSIINVAKHLEQGQVVIFAAGTGNPFFTTDSAASLRAIEIGADIMLKATKVDGVYTADPVTDPGATLYTRISYDAALAQKLGVMDATALVLCSEHNMPVRVFNVFEAGHLGRIMDGQDIGTLVES